MTFSKEEKAKKLEEWKMSGKSKWAFAKENRINQQTFANWVNKEKAIGFVEIKPNSKSLVQVAQTECSQMVIEKGDIKIHLPIVMSSKDLTAIIESLREAI